MNRVYLFFPLLYSISVECPLVIDIATKLQVSQWNATKMNLISMDCCGEYTGVLCLNELSWRLTGNVQVVIHY